MVGEPCPDEAGELIVGERGAPARLAARASRAPPFHPPKHADVDRYVNAHGELLAELR
jgi:hypothetical protein